MIDIMVTPEFFCLLYLLLARGIEILKSLPAVIKSGHRVGSFNMFHFLCTVTSLVKSAKGNLAELSRTILEFWTMLHQAMVAENVQQRLDSCKKIAGMDGHPGIR